MSFLNCFMYGLADAWEANLPLFMYLHMTFFAVWIVVDRLVIMRYLRLIGVPEDKISFFFWKNKQLVQDYIKNYKVEELQKNLDMPVVGYTY